MSKHTPGPWSVLRDAVTVVPPKPRGQTIICRAVECYMDRAQREANARLIAAAPDLLIELQNAVAFMQSVMDERGDHGVSILLRAARAAIAKATGEA